MTTLSDAIAAGASAAGLDGDLARRHFESALGGGVSRADIQAAARAALTVEAEAVRAAGRRLAAAVEKRDRLRATLDAAKGSVARVADLRAAVDQAAREAGETHARYVAGAATASEKAEADQKAADAKARLDAAEVAARDDLMVFEHGARPLADAESEVVAAERLTGLAGLEYLQTRRGFAEGRLAMSFMLHVAPWAAEVAACHEAALRLFGTRLEGFDTARRREQEGYQFPALESDGARDEILTALRRASGVAPDWKVTLRLA